MDIVNTRLLAHPMNWLFVWLVILLASMAYGAIHDGFMRSSPDAQIIPD